MCCAGASSSGVLLLNRISLEDVSLRKIVEIRQRDAAVVAASHLADVVLESLQVGDAAASDLLAGAQHAADRVARDPAVDHMRSRDRGLAVDGEDPAYLSTALEDLDH